MSQDNNSKESMNINRPYGTVDPDMYLASKGEVVGDPKLMSDSQQLQEVQKADTNFSDESVGFSSSTQQQMKPQSESSSNPPKPQSEKNERILLNEERGNDSSSFKTSDENLKSLKSDTIPQETEVKKMETDMTKPMIIPSPTLVQKSQLSSMELDKNANFGTQQFEKQPTLKQGGADISMDESERQPQTQQFQQPQQQQQQEFKVQSQRPKHVRQHSKGMKNKQQKEVLQMPQKEEAEPLAETQLEKAQTLLDGNLEINENESRSKEAPIVSEQPVKLQEAPVQAEPLKTRKKRSRSHSKPNKQQQQQQIQEKDVSMGENEVGSKQTFSQGGIQNEQIQQQGQPSEKKPKLNHKAKVFRSKSQNNQPTQQNLFQTEQKPLQDHSKQGSDVVMNESEIRSNQQTTSETKAETTKSKLNPNAKVFRSQSQNNQIPQPPPKEEIQTPQAQSQQKETQQQPQQKGWKNYQPQQQRKVWRPKSSENISRDQIQSEQQTESKPFSLTTSQDIEPYMMKYGQLDHNAREKQNIAIVYDFLKFVHSEPERSKKLLASETIWICPSNFENKKTIQEYVDVHKPLLAQLRDLAIISIDALFGKDRDVCVRYTCEGTHNGSDHDTISATNKKARWSGACVFRLNDDGKIVELIKDFNKLSLYETLGWSLTDCDVIFSRFAPQQDQLSSQMRFDEDFPQSKNHPYDEYSIQERANLKAVHQFMSIAYSPSKASGSAVARFLANSNKFLAPTTFPDVYDCGAFADANSKIMKSLLDLKIDRYDFFFAKNNWVCLRYAASGSHCGDEHNGIKATNRRAVWSSTAIFKLNDESKIELFFKEWNKWGMWSQLGWPRQECLISGNEMPVVLQSLQLNPLSASGKSFENVAPKKIVRTSSVSFDTD